MDLLRKANLKVNRKKCTWLKKSVKILGHIVFSNGIQMDPEKIDKITQMKPPQNIKQLQTFLGLTGYYRRFIKDYAKTTSPLMILLRKYTEW